MFDNLTMEVFYYSLIPAAIIAVITLLILLFKRKNGKQYKYNYIIRILLIIMISFVLPFIIGYTIWTIERYIAKGIMLSNIPYAIILGVLIIVLIVLLCIICKKLYGSFTEEKRVSE